MFRIIHSAVAIVLMSTVPGTTLAQQNSASPSVEAIISPEVSMYFGTTEPEIRENLAIHGLQLVFFRHEASYNEVHAIQGWRRWIMKLSDESGLVIVIEQE